MGYRSDWTIVFNTCGKAKAVKATLEQYIKANPPASESVLMAEMLQSAILDENDDVLELADSWWKLGAWDSLICTLNTLFGNDEEIDIGWARIGEDESDIESCSGSFTNVFVSRNIECDVSPVPPAINKSTDDELHNAQPAAQDVCKCDLYQLMAGNGHDPGCSGK